MVALGHFVNVSFAKRKVETRLEKRESDQVDGGP